MSYPLNVALNDGRNITVVVKERENIDEMAKFFSSLAPEDRLFLRRDVTQREVLEERARELESGAVFRLAAYDGERIIGEASLYRRPYSWNHHVGEMRIIIARDFQRAGVGSVLARELFLNAVSLNYRIVEAFMLTDDSAALRCVEKLGFKEECILKGHATDIRGAKRDLVVMTFSTDEMWDQLREVYDSLDLGHEC